METKRLNNQTTTFKWALTFYLLLSLVGFSVAGMISKDRYSFDHEKTATYYLGNETEMAFPKLYGQLIQTAHVHTFTLPLVFLVVWLGMAYVPVSKTLRVLLMLGGVFSILIYNGAPFVLRYVTSKGAFFFTVGGVGLYLFYLIPAFLLLYETWLGFNRARDN